MMRKERGGARPNLQDIDQNGDERCDEHNLCIDFEFAGDATQHCQIDEDGCDDPYHEH